LSKAEYSKPWNMRDMNGPNFRGQEEGKPRDGAKIGSEDEFPIIMTFRPCPWLNEKEKRGRKKSRAHQNGLVVGPGFRSALATHN